MAAAGQQDIITILLVSKFKRNEPWAYWVECLPLKNSEGLSRNRNSIEHFYKYEQKIIFIVFQWIFAL